MDPLEQENGFDAPKSNLTSKGSNPPMEAGSSPTRQDIGSDLGTASTSSAASLIQHLLPHSSENPPIKFPPVTQKQISIHSIQLRLFWLASVKGDVKDD